MALTVKTLVEKRDEILVTCWCGEWEEAYGFSKLFPNCEGFSVNGAGLIVQPAAGSAIYFAPGTYVEIEEGPYCGRYKFVRILEPGEFNQKWQPRTPC